MAIEIQRGDLASIADQFGLQLFGELDYVREANNCERFRELYGDWDNVIVPEACTALTRRRVLVMEWVEGVKGPWPGDRGISMVESDSSVLLTNLCILDCFMQTHIEV